MQTITTDSLIEYMSCKLVTVDIEKKAVFLNQLKEYEANERILYLTPRPNPRPHFKSATPSMAYPLWDAAVSNNLNVPSLYVTHASDFTNEEELEGYWTAVISGECIVIIGSNEFTEQIVQKVIEMNCENYLFTWKEG